MSTETSVPHPRLSGAEGQPMDASDAALYATLMRQSAEGFAFFDAGLRCRRASDALGRLLGVPVADLQRRGLAEVLSAAVAAEFEAALATGAEADLTVPGEGGERVLACAWLPARDEDGALLGAVLTARDVTERRRAEEVVRRKEQRYRSLVEASAQVVWVAAPDGTVIDDAPEWRAITGQTPDDYAAGGWLAVVHPEDRARIEAIWRECVGEDRVFETGYRVRTKSGTYRHFDVRAVPIWRGGTVIEWVGANTDVTGQREAEEMRGRLTEQLSAAALRTARLQQATSMLAEALTVAQVVQVITEVGRSAIGADFSAVALLDDDKLRLSIVTPAQPGEGGAPEGGAAVRGDIKVSDQTVMSVAVRESRPFLAEHPNALRLQLGRDEAELFSRHNEERAWVGLPLLAAGAPIGALRFAFTRPREITEEERVFLEALAGQCALAVERALLFEREHKTAEELQRSLLPSDLPQLPNMVLAARYNPATRHVQVGGDWYDVFRLPDDRLAVAAGDVMGKGVLAAAGMGRVRNALRALALNDPRPAAVLAGLDRLFSATEDEEQFTTVAYAVIDPDTGQGAFSNAGHMPPLLIFPDEAPRVSTSEPGTPLGWPSQRQQTSFSIETGNTVVFYSDGLVENRRRGVDAGLEELVSVAASAPPEVVGDPERLVDFLVDRMLAGYEQVDDVTVLALHVPPKSTQNPRR
ncbi:SpoIIE family protein phosphatase [Actinomadura macrotermitis]|uniref:PAS domain S-box-containing protein n=1 Tax=Actinomadura macrotermitis TaxID=2585200 RepID=A0A7K0C4G4_9ACTN|nr:SpoIIE family protein phosphatase [Actinomadura macrotermitis]MQY08330.1 hypothetical protein [Actinomadura macrotermitis]